jgi:exopolysaccharide production protein ExoZ
LASKFVISGFVIANSANGVSPISFARSRVLRLYPAVWICAPITLFAWLLIDGAEGRELIGELLRSGALWVQGPWIDGVYWTLAIEMIFYALVFLLLVVRRFSWLPYLAGGLAVYSGAFLLLQWMFGDVLSAAAPWRLLRAQEELLLLRHGCFFAVGIFLWLSTVRRLSPWEWGLAAAATGFCCIEIAWRAEAMATDEVHVVFDMNPLIPMILWLSTLALMFAFVRMPERFAPRSERSRALLQHLGKMTYPLYLMHSVVGAGVIRLLIEAGWDQWSALAIGASLMLVIASLIALAFEPAVRRILRAGWERAEPVVEKRALAFLFKPGGAVERVN